MRPATRFNVKPLALLLGGALLLPAQTAWAYDAEIVAVVGKGETRASARDNWRAAAVRQKLDAGAFVRTGDLSQMALLLQEQTQLRLNQNSMLQIKEVSLAGAPTKLEMNQGRAWMQSKRKAVTASRDPVVTIQTPSATAAIRGTDWELVVDKAGVSTLTVLSGEVEFYNDQGRLSVRPNEQARAEPGKAPTKLLLTNARERVQWVTAYRPQPRRWLRQVPAALEPTVAAIEAGRYADAMAVLEGKTASGIDAALLLADMHLFLGRVQEAIRLLKPLAGDPRAAALLVRAHLIDDQAAEASRQLAVARASQPKDVELMLAQGDLARIEGDARGAVTSFQEAVATQAGHAEGWFGIGRVEAEREAVKPGRQALNQALSLNPEGLGYRGELATLETFANQFDAAEKAFAEALAQQPDDYVALTGLGILRLKQGKPEAALEAFLKAGVLEPRFARAAMYTGVAYYQLGNAQRALEMFQRAAELDAKDPLPHMMLSLAASDRMAFGEAIVEAQRAAELMPYLKSLNQLLNDQKGNANVGAALAQFGQEEWAQAYAHNAYTPYWAGSHLFLADRFSGTYNKNSELFQGFLSDPSVFGASNRFNSLVASPGHYATLGARALSLDWQERSASAVFNGYSVANMPFAYYVGAERSWARPDVSTMRADGQNLTVGLGAKPSHELSLFMFGTDSPIDARLSDPAIGITDSRFDLHNRRLDVGANYKLSPTSHLWLKAGDGRDNVKANGTLSAPELSDLLNSLFLLDTPVSPNGTLNVYRANTNQHDLQLRHSVDINPRYQLSWGMEFAGQDKRVDIEEEFVPAVARLGQTTRHDSGEVYVSNRFKFGEALLVQADLGYVQLDKRYLIDDALLFSGLLLSGGTPELVDRNIREWNPRLGLAWHPAPGQTLRAAAQKWRRGAGVNTLAPVDTVGIALDDRLVAVGGEMKRARLQYEWEADAKSFLMGFIDSKRVDNLANPGGTLVADFNLQDLDRLRNRNRLSPQALDYWEATPEFAAAEVDGIGFAANRLLSAKLSANLRYHYNDSRNTSATFRGNKVPWLARHLFSVGADWLPVARWQLGATLTYRSERFADEANTQRLSGGWNLGLRSYWEDAGKHWSVEAIVDNLYSNKASTTTRSPVFGVQALYRF